MTRLVPTLFAALFATAAAAQDSYTCSVSELQFEGTSDQSWVDGNMAKVFTIELMGDTVRLSTTSPRFDPTRTELILVTDQGLAAIAATVSMTGMDVLAYPANPAMRAEPFEATWSVINNSFVNTWVLACQA